MKRTHLILISGLTLAVAGFVCAYAVATARSPERTAKPELAWLKQEYQLSNEQYTHVCELEAGYQPKCREMCREIDASNARLKELLAATNAVTSEIRQALAETAQLRAKCQAAMLNHFYEVSRAMPSEQGERYLAWMQKETLVPSPMAAKHSQ